LISSGSPVCWSRSCRRPDADGAASRSSGLGCGSGALHPWRILVVV
jgi:hypothetical protein